MKKNILIVGGLGFLGVNLVLSLYKSKRYNLIISSRKYKKFFKIKKNISFVKCDFSSLKNLKIKFGNKKIDVVINFGGNIEHHNKSQTEKSHYRICKNLVDLFSKKKIELFIQAGSSMEYGKIKSPNYEKNYAKPNSIYGKSKLRSTRYLEKSKINYIVLRLYQIYGPHQKIDRLIPLAIDSLLKGKRFDTSSGTQVRDFLYVDDFISLIKKILKKKLIKRGIYNVGSGRPINVRNVLKKIKTIIGKGEINYNAIKMRKDEIKLLYPNINKVKKYFNWESKTQLNKGLKKTIKFYEKQ